MKHAFTHLQERLNTKNLTQLSIGAFLIQSIKHKSKYPDELSGYLRWHKLHIQLDPREDRMQWFVTRVQLRDELNTLLADNGYEYELKEVRIK